MEKATSRLLALVIPLKGAVSPPNIGELRQRIEGDVREINNLLPQAGYDNHTTRAAHYCLCALIDEIILDTPWGGQSDWRDRSLLVTYHGDAWGGDRFFDILDRANQNPGSNRDLLEFLYLCLTLGFQGKYGPLPNGAEQLNRIREDLYQVIRAHRPEFERELSPSWRPVTVKSSALARYIPLWALAIVCAGILLAVFFGFRLTLNHDSNPLLSDIAGLDGAALAELAAPVRPPSPPTRRASLTLQQLLADEYAAGEVDFRETANSVTVLIVAEGFFAPASARVSDRYDGILSKVGQALGQVEGSVLIAGHTDNQPIRSLRYPSNLELSQDRARSVLDYLVDVVGDPVRFRSEGRADLEPLASNDTPEGRARNRRVEITLTPPRGASA
ncbi:MAG: type IVB secretion system protein IcmH/DotU [Xanthomonadales bacterium]|nr:type IVB secretion system protein IcmH/DotU [Xanthomonadales bacterium]